jgi:hypothetical protein
MNPRTAAKQSFVLVIAIAASARAVQLNDGALSINGFGSWSWADTVHGPNRYNASEPAGSYGAGQFALLVTAVPYEHVVLGAQINIEPDAGGAQLDWAFAEYRFSDGFHVHAGRFKHAIGISGDVLEVGTLRPFAQLASGVYGSSEIVFTGVEGVGASGSFNLGSWSLAYDVYFGALDTKANNPYETVLLSISNPSALPAGGTIAFVDEESRDVLGGRLILGAPIDGLSFRASAYGSRRGEDGDIGARWVAGVSAEYLTEKISLRAEYFFHHDFLIANSHAAYVEGAYFFTEHLQIGLRGEVFETDLAGVAGDSSLLSHDEVAATVNWWFAPQLVVKLQGSYVHGNRFAQPASVNDAIRSSTLDEQTTALFATVNFSF